MEGEKLVWDSSFPSKHCVFLCRYLQLPFLQAHPHNNNKKVKRGNTWFYFSPIPFSSVKSIFESDRKNNVKQASGLWYLCFIKFCMKSIQIKYLINNTTIFGLSGYYQSNICFKRWILLKYIVHEAHIVQHKVHDIKYQISASLNNQISNIWFFGQISDRKCESVVQQRLGP